MWREDPLGSLAEIVSGGTPSRDVPAYWNGDIPWVTPTDITACETNTLADPESRITELGLLSSSAKQLPAGTILLTSRASIGLAKMAAASASSTCTSAAPSIRSPRCACWRSCVHGSRQAWTTAQRAVLG